MSKFPDQRVGVLVDVQNMYYSAKSIHNKKTDFQEILKVAGAGRKIVRATAYCITTKEGTEEKFIESLRKANYEIKAKELQIFKDGAKKGDWDVGIAIDAIKLANNLDVIVIVSGDGDYIPLVKYLQFNQGVQVEIMAFEESCSQNLILEADEFTNLSNYKSFFRR